MSKPKRYDVGMTTEFNPHGFNHSFPRVYEAEQGKYVEYADYVRLLAEVKELKSQPDPLTAYLYAAELAKDDIKRLKAQVERLTKAVMHSPAAQLKLKELEGKTTFEDINPKEGKPHA